jgi:bifunctional DNase/RNase
MENLPNKKIKVSKLNNIENLELVPVKLEHILISPDNHTFALIVGDDKDIAIPLNSYEGSMLSFVFKGLHKNSHINTIHQLFVKFINDQNTKIESIYIESKVGDIIYASIHFVDNKHRRFYSISSLIDALILYIINKHNQKSH